MPDQRERTAREHTYKIRLSEMERLRLEQIAADHDMSAANLIRVVVLGSGYVYQSQLPSTKILRKSLFAITNIAHNVNQAVTAVNTAAKAGRLNSAEAAAVVEALSNGRAEVLHSAELIRGELSKFRYHGGVK